MSAVRPLFFLVAGEPSGDLLGGRLMAALRQETGDAVTFAGIGGPRMIEQGLQPLFPMEELSIMGLAEVVPQIPHMLRRIRETTGDIARLRPAAVVTIDAPDFSFRVARRVRGLGIPLIHYVAPSVWAWRPGRAATIAGFLDHLMALLPFEPPYFEKVGLPCTFVGHPAVEAGQSWGDGNRFREKHGIPSDRNIVVMLPGSRRGEIRRLLAPFIATLKLLRARGLDFKTVVPVSAHLAGQVAAALTASGLDAVVVEGEAEKRDAFAAAAAALAKSGTVTLELALAAVPTVIAYRLNPLTFAIASRMITGRFAGLPNIILDRELMPEFLQDDCRPDRLADALGAVLRDGPDRRTQIEGMVLVGASLSPPGLTPSQAAARVVLRVARDGKNFRSIGAVTPT
jgi:lipid-A-disaccharide synthase